MPSRLWQLIRILARAVLYLMEQYEPSPSDHAALLAELHALAEIPPKED